MKSDFYSAWHSNKEGTGWSHTKLLTPRLITQPVWDGGNQLGVGEYILAMSRLGMVGEVYSGLVGKVENHVWVVIGVVWKSVT